MPSEGLMRAAVYRGKNDVRVEQIPVPKLGPGEILIRVESCGVCHTDLKKIEYALLEPPRIFGHETAGVVAAVGEGVKQFAVGDRVIAFHHIPCGTCFYCERKLYAQCPVYKKVGITAGFEPSGGGYAEYARVMPWIVERGVEKIPAGVDFDTASFVEPVNTCLKAVAQSGARPGDLAIVAGQGPIGLIFTMLLKRAGVRTVVTDLSPERRARGLRYGALEAIDPRTEDLTAHCAKHSEGRGADLAFVAVSAPGVVEGTVAATRPGAHITLFAQTSDKERIDLSGASICKDERILAGAYSADVDLQGESARIVFEKEIPVGELVTHTFPLEAITEGIKLATHPSPESLKIVIKPQAVTG